LWLVVVSLLLMVARARVAPTTVAECAAPGDADERVFHLVDRGGDAHPRWWMTLQSRRLGARTVDLPLADAQVERSASSLAVSSRSRNGGLAVALRAGDRSSLDVFVNFELEVNVWRDLSPDVEQMNTDGPLADVQCRILSAGD
jgi:hypothetical protein